MSEHQPGGPEDPGVRGSEPSDAGDAAVGGLSPAPTASFRLDMGGIG